MFDYMTCTLCHCVITCAVDVVSQLKGFQVIRVFPNMKDPCSQCLNTANPWLPTPHLSDGICILPSPHSFGFPAAALLSLPKGCHVLLPTSTGLGMCHWYLCRRSLHLPIEILWSALYFCAISTVYSPTHSR